MAGGTPYTGSKVLNRWEDNLGRYASKTKILSAFKMNPSNIYEFLVRLVTLRSYLQYKDVWYFAGEKTFNWLPSYDRAPHHKIYKLKLVEICSVRSIILLSNRNFFLYRDVNLYINI